MKKKWVLIVFCFMTVFALLAAGKKAASKTVIVIDVGHGGKDPGKVGVNGALEKDVNLHIAKKLEQVLKKKYEVILTRSGDEKKSLKERVEFIEEQIPKLVISIHQNSYPSPNVKGAQVFYYTDSEEGKRLAEILQGTIKTEITDGNHREAKGNRDYYILSHTTIPLAIVECGFLSCPEEEKKLQSEEYQKKMAEAISKGIEMYLAEP